MTTTVTTEMKPISNPPLLIVGGRDHNLTKNYPPVECVLLANYSMVGNCIETQLQDHVQYATGGVLRQGDQNIRVPVICGGLINRGLRTNK